MNGVDFSGINDFSGTFNGNGYAIKNLTINNNTSDYTGLFKETSGGSIIDVGLENCNITGNTEGSTCTGGLVGLAIGSSNAGTISNSYSTCNITSEYGRSGGFVGILGGVNGRVNFTIKNSFTTGNIIQRA